MNYGDIDMDYNIILDILIQHGLIFRRGNKYYSSCKYEQDITKEIKEILKS